MAKPIAIIQQELRALSVAEKQEILATLMEELDGPPEEGVDAAWREEVERRAAEIDNGSVKCIPADEVFAKLDAKLRK
jgi:putative addiction module component (TIGR02574 family)